MNWKPITDYVEPDWDSGRDAAPMLLWREKKGGAVYGFIRDGEVFDHNWVYVCDANKVTHIAEITPPVGAAASAEARK